MSPGVVGAILQSAQRPQRRFLEGRYHSTLIDGDKHLRRCTIYIELNMVRAGAVPHPEQWPWCSDHKWMGQRRRRTLINLKRRVVSFGNNPCRRSAGVCGANRQSNFDAGKLWSRGRTGMAPGSRRRHPPAFWSWSLLPLFIPRVPGDEPLRTTIWAQKPAVRPKIDALNFTALSYYVACPGPTPNVNPPEVFAEAKFGVGNEQLSGWHGG